MKRRQILAAGVNPQDSNHLQPKSRETATDSSCGCQPAGQQPPLAKKAVKRRQILAAGVNPQDSDHLQRKSRETATDSIVLVVTIVDKN